MLSLFIQKIADIGDIMVTYKELQKNLKDNINDKTKDELYSLTELLVAEFYKAYDDKDLPRMKEIKATMDDFKDGLKSKFDNVDAVFNGVELQKQKEYHVLHQYQHMLETGKDRILIYQLILNELSAKVGYLRKILIHYFLNTAVIDNGNVDGLDDVIGDIRDDIVGLSGVADMYFNDSTADSVNSDIETSKEIIHDVFNYDYMEFLKKNGMVEIQIELMDVYKKNHQCNKEYKQLKLEIDKLFTKNNGFKDISESFIRMVKSETKVGASADVIIDYLPEYDVATATFIPAEIPISEN